MESPNTTQITSPCGSIASHCEQGVTPLPCDAAIVQAILAYDGDLGGREMNIVVCNHEGNMYRHISTVSFNAFMHMVSTLWKLELKDLRVYSAKNHDGIHAEFVPQQQGKIL